MAGGTALRCCPALLRAGCRGNNHSGDSDSTGAITGNLLGTWFGQDALPRPWVTGLGAALPEAVTPGQAVGRPQHDLLMPSSVHRHTIATHDWPSLHYL
ncbi:ADP-ribosylglycohydrolase family protein [Actinocorallia sp. B10E7]|uniref:ADP-ribosylglycohydrolase family protein n=1 Tax=Actinocorallia sp. B10E7 TaxID=3153558 RepID=UPI00325FA68F